MPKARKKWDLVEGATPRSPQNTSPARLLIPCQIELEPAIPSWAIIASFNALLGRDNRKIPSDLGIRLPSKIKEFVLLLSAVEDQGVKFSHAMKGQLVGWFVRDVLKVKQPPHPRAVLQIHSAIVDSFIDNMGWPIKIKLSRQDYELALSQNLPRLLAKLAEHPCNCQKITSLTILEIESLACITSPGALRDAIVASHHCIAAASMRGSRTGQRPRQRLKK